MGVMALPEFLMAPGSEGWRSGYWYGHHAVPVPVIKPPRRCHTGSVPPSPETWILAPGPGYACTYTCGFPDSAEQNATQ
jgi:hypothetical protein